MSAMVFDISLSSYDLYGLREIPNMSCNNRENPHATLRILFCNFRYFYYAINRRSVLPVMRYIFLTPERSPIIMSAAHSVRFS